MAKIPKRFLRKPLKTKKQRKKIKFFIFFFLSLALLCSIGYILFFTKYFKIESIEIDNQTPIKTDEIKQVIYSHINNDRFLFIKRNSVFLIDKWKINKEISSKYPIIKFASFKLNIWKREINIKIEKREPVAIWCKIQNKPCFLMDDETIIFQETEEKDFQGLPKIESNIQNQENKLGEKAYDIENLHQILLAYTDLKDAVKIQIEKFIVDETNFLTAKTKDGWEVYLNLDDEMHLPLLKLKTILEKELPKEKRQSLQYIDLRFTKVYYK